MLRSRHLFVMLLTFSALAFRPLAAQSASGFPANGTYTAIGSGIDTLTASGLRPATVFALPGPMSNAGLLLSATLTVSGTGGAQTFSLRTTYRPINESASDFDLTEPGTVLGSGNVWRLLIGDGLRTGKSMYLHQVNGVYYLFPAPLMRVKMETQSAGIRVRKPSGL